MSSGNLPEVLEDPDRVRDVLAREPDLVGGAEDEVVRLGERPLRARVDLAGRAEQAVPVERRPRRGGARVVDGGVGDDAVEVRL